MRTGEIALDRTDAKFSVLAISGEHDLNTAPDLRAQLDELIAARAPVVVDLSAGDLRRLVDPRRHPRRPPPRRRRGHRLRGRAGDDGADAVARVLEITGLREELPVHGSREAAERGGRATPEGRRS